MRDLFIDTEIIIDYLGDRTPHVENARRILALIENKKIKGHVSSFCFIKLHYLLRKQMSESRTLSVLRELSGILNIYKVDEESIIKALDSGLNNFADAVQYFSAMDYKRTELILTRSVTDYKFSELPVLTPDTFLKTFGAQIKGT